MLISISPDWEKAEAEAKLRKQERDEALQRKVVEIDNFYAALKGCMHQLITSAREHDERVHEAVMKASKEFEKKNKKLEEKYVETSRMVAKLTFENSQLTTAIQVKEKLTDDANEQMCWTTGEFDILMARLDSKETENAFLKSEYKKLEKELEIRNEEMEFNSRSSDALEKKHLENVRKINKLEAECRKLRAMVRKQTPGSPEPARTNYSIVEMQGKVPNEVPDNTEPRDFSTAKSKDWLQNVLKAILEQNKVSKTSMDEILEDIRVALKPTDQLDSTARTETSQLEESEQSNERLQLEVESLQESKRLVEKQIENQKLINEDLITELTASKVQLNEVLEKLSSLELELEDRSQCCEELEAECLKLQHQLERYMCSVSSKELPKDNGPQQDENLFHTGWETTAASAQLEEFQETILNHEKQLKTQNSPKMGDHDQIWSQHASLLDHMIAEDGVSADQDINSPKTKEIATTTEMDSPPLLPFSGDQSFYVARPSAVSGALSIVSTTKPSGGISLLRKLIFRMKKGGSKKKTSSLMRYRSSRDHYFL